jgi:hypothetical protein
MTLTSIITVKEWVWFLNSTLFGICLMILDIERKNTEISQLRSLKLLLLMKTDELLKILKTYLNSSEKSVGMTALS